MFALSSVVARGGTILLTRDSTIRASGKAGSADFDLLDGSHAFDGFSDLVDTVDAGVSARRVAANQHSTPAVSAADGFIGAFAEGSASAEFSEGLADEARAMSTFDLTFQILGVPSVVNFGGSVGLTGHGSASVSLSNEVTGDILLSQQLLDGASEGQQIEHSTVLTPGVYALSVMARVDGESSESMAYYSVSLSLSPFADEDGGPTPIPLPAALWSAATLLAAGGAVHGFSRFARGRRSM